MAVYARIEKVKRMRLKIYCGALTGIIGLTLLNCPVQAAISMDRTRIIFDGNQKSMSVSISNGNKQLPYLAQGWIEDAEGKKIQSPLIVLPPVQRLEPGKSSQIKIEALPAVSTLPQDRESLFYFNLREIPPKTNKPNTLQIALQTRVKLFYRPETLTSVNNTSQWQEKLTLSKQGDRVIVNNPTPYYITIVNINSVNNNEFKPVMVSPFGQDYLGLVTSQLGNHPELSYVDDYGGRPTLKFSCMTSVCQVVSVKEK